MAGVRRNLVIRAGIDLTAFSRGMDRMQRDLEKRAKKLNQLGNKMAMALTVPIMAVTGLGVKMSSDLAESISKVEATFNSSANVIEEWSKTTLKSIGLAQQTALDMAATYGDLGTSLGLTTQEAAKMSMSLVQLAGDLASFKNIKIDVANTALMAIYTGETESLFYSDAA
jgi:hypothetical protein